MSQETEAPFLDDESLPENDTVVSKSQLKRDSEALKTLGKTLCALNPQQLARIPLDDSLKDAIELAHRLSNKRGALKRHYQYIGKLLRSIDAQPILDAVLQFDEESNQATLAFKKIENWRDRMLTEGDAAIQDYCQTHAQADRQKIRQIVRNHQQAKDDNKRTRFARLLFKELRANA